MKLLSAFGLLICPLVSFGASESTLNLLRGYEWREDRIQIDTSNEQLESELREVAAGLEGKPNYFKYRAIMLLRHFQSEETAVFLENRISGSGDLGVVRRSAESFALGFASSQPERVVRAIGPLLKHQNLAVRSVTMENLLRVDTPQARAVLRLAVQAEKNESLKRSVSTRLGIGR